MSRDLLVSYWARIDFGSGRWVGGREIGFIMLTYVVGPFEFDGYVRVASVICFNTFYNCEGGDVLEKDDGSLV